MHANRQVFWNDFATATTTLRGVAWVNRDHLNPGLDSLVVQKLAEYTQADIVGGACQLIVAQHESQVQLFQDDNAIGGDQPKSDFMPPITALIGNMFVFLRQHCNRLFTAVATFFTTGNFALQAFEAFERWLRYCGLSMIVPSLSASAW